MVWLLVKQEKTITKMQQNKKIWSCNNATIPSLLKFLQWVFYLCDKTLPFSKTVLSFVSLVWWESQFTGKSRSHVLLIFSEFRSIVNCFFTYVWCNEGLFDHSKKKMAAVQRQRQNATFKESRFHLETIVANLGYKNPLNQRVILFFFLESFICIALMEIN